MSAVKSKTFVPRPERRPVSLRGYALSETRDCDIFVDDVSYTGCAIRCSDELKPGEHVELRIIKRGASQAEIRWAARGRAGARFLG